MDQLTKFPQAAKVVAQIILERYNYAQLEGYRNVVGKFFKTLREAELEYDFDAYLDPDSHIVDESAYGITLWYNDPGSIALMEIETVGVFQISKKTELDLLADCIAEEYKQKVGKLRSLGHIMIMLELSLMRSGHTELHFSQLTVSKVCGYMAKHDINWIEFWVSNKASYHLDKSHSGINEYLENLLDL